MPELRLPAIMQGQLLEALDSGEQKTLKGVLRSLVQASPHAPPNSKPRRSAAVGVKPAANRASITSPDTNGMLL